METFLFGLSLFLYVLSSAGYHTHLFTGSERARRFATLFLAAALVVHTGVLGVWCTTHTGSILRDPGMPFSLVAYFLALVQLVADFRKVWSSLGMLSVPLAFLLQFTALARTPGGTVEQAPRTALLAPHVMVVVLGFVAFALAFCVALLYLLQSRLLKTKKVRGVVRRLPSLESVHTAAHWLAGIGFSMLTLGIITGVIVAPERFGPTWYLDAHTLTSIVAWGIYAAYLGGSLLLGWRGRRTTYFLIAGFLVVLLAFVVTVGRSRPVQVSSAARPEPAPAFRR